MSNLRLSYLQKVGWILVQAIPQPPPPGFTPVLMTWHYKRLTQATDKTHIEIIYSMRARKIYAFLHFKPAI